MSPAFQLAALLTLPCLAAAVLGPFLGYPMREMGFDRRAASVVRVVFPLSALCAVLAAWGLFMIAATRANGANGLVWLVWPLGLFGGAVFGFGVGLCIVGSARRLSP